MKTTLDIARLSTGETLEIAVVEAPDEQWSDAVKDLLVHKSDCWQYHIAEALAGRTDRMETRFHLGIIDGRAVANIMTMECLGTGILGHVFTRPEHRRKGICKLVMQRQMDHFRARGGQALLLGTGFESHAYWIYHSFGFRSLRGGFMRYATEPGYAFEDRWLAPAPADVVALEWRHHAPAAVMAALPGREYLRSAAWRMRDFGELEWPIIAYFHAKSDNPALVAVALETHAGAVGGIATVLPMDGWRDVWFVDAIVHPNFVERTADLIAGLPTPDGKLVSFADRDACERRAALEACGFRLEGTLSGFLRGDDSARDVVIYGKEQS